MEGMEEIVASVSGYHGIERFKLIKLISLSGANYVGALTRSTTHLVCWKFEGEKYTLAKKFGTKIVNHQWLEDCIKKRKRIPEKSYSLQSGQQVGSITLDVPAISKELGVLRKKKLVLNGGHKSCTDPVIDIEYEITEHQDWDDRWLFAKNEESSKGVSNSSRKKKKRIHDRTTTRDTISTDPPRSSRRLVNKNASIYPMESLANNGNKSLGNEILNVDDNVASTSNHFSLRNENVASTVEGHRDAFTSQRRARNHSFSEIEASDVPETGAEDLILQREETVSTPERTLQDARSDVEKVNEKLKMAEQDEQPARNTASLDLSCVICWTRFSSTRGVLPCGHRFCFSCIQNWADCMVSKGKTSTCPLCKSSFMTITKVDEADCVDQKIYSQTVPCASSTQDIFILPDGPPVFNHLQVQPPEPACCQCHSREPEDLLVQCDVCHLRCIHCYCLDPPLFPWICSSCKDFRMFYSRY
ncbi:hypothetical protein V2J09_003357 [Rumex salicifolius]